MFPFNPDRVLADTPKPLTEFTTPKADELKEGPYPQHEALPTPATPVSAEALTSLLNIIKLVSDNETSRQHKERLQQKVTTAAQTFLAKNALLEDRNQFLTKINDEGKVRRSTKSETLGNARVMSFEDLEKARAERVIKEATKEAKKAAKEAKEAAKEAKEGVKEVKKLATAVRRTRSRKCKSGEEGGTPELKAIVVRTSEAKVENEVTLQPWRAPVARMW